MTIDRKLTRKRVKMNLSATDEIRRLIGNPAQVAQELAKFRETTEILSSNQPRLIDEYAKQWVALYDHKVQANAGTLDELMAEVDSAGLPREHVIVRFVDKDVRTLVL